MKHWGLRAVRGTALAVLAEVSARAANTIFFIMLTWSLGETEASTYTLGFTFSTFLIQFAFGGLDQLLNREVARDRAQSALLLGNFLLARLLSSLLCYAALIAWLFGPFSTYAWQINQVVLVLGATLITDNLTNLCQAYLIAYERVGQITLLSAVTGVVKLTLGALILSLGGGALAAAWVVLATSLVTITLYLCYIGTRIEWPRVSLDRSFWFVQARSELPLLLIAIMSTVEGSLDALLLTRSGNPLGLGVFAAATLILNSLLIIPQTYRQIILPILMASYTTVRERAYTIYVQSGRGLLILTLPICASITLVADQAMPMLYHNEFMSAVGVMQILAWSFVFTCMAVPNGRLMLVAGRQSASVPIQLCSMIINVALNFFLQPALGAQGAALARVASTLAVYILSLIYIQRRIYRWNVWPVVVGPLAATLCLALATIGLRWLGVHWLLALVIGWLIYGIALVAFRGISPTELRSLIALRSHHNAQTIVKGPS